MKDWGLDREIENVRITLAIARYARSMAGNGDDRLVLIGMSDGARAGYAYLNGETQVARGLRHVKAFVPVDQHLKFDAAALRQLACGRAAAQRALIDAGSDSADDGTVMAMAGRGAELRPNDPSPVIPGLTNLQAALLVGAASYLFMTDTPTFHWAAGVFNDFGIPIGLQYMRTDFYVKLIQGFARTYPRQLIVDYEDLACDETDVPFDDHLSKIAIPVLYVGAQGGIGDYGVYSTTLLGSADVTVHLVSTWPPEARALDFGHIDLMYGDNAEGLVWQPILMWIRAQR